MQTTFFLKKNNMPEAHEDYSSLQYRGEGRHHMVLNGYYLQ